jgi:hypothetical protein
MFCLLDTKPRRDLIVEFFNEQVDEKSNLLNLSVLTYVQNEWAKECATIMRSVAVDVIFPFMELLGIDDHKYASNPDRNWVGVKVFLPKKSRSSNAKFLPSKGLAFLSTSFTRRASPK